MDCDKDYHRESECEELILLCEDSLDGIWTAVYEAYRTRQPSSKIRIQTREDNYRLFATYQEIRTAPVLSAKVASTLQSRLGEEGYLRLCRALASQEEDKADAVYHFVCKALLLSQPAVLFERIADPVVNRVFVLDRNVGNEIHHMLGFLRFEEVKGPVLAATMGPVNNILPFLMPHFSDRLPGDDFVVYDEKRHLFGIHPAYKTWYLSTVEDFDDRILQETTEREEEYQDLFRQFCTSISIRERENRKCQRNFLPLRYRKYMTEFPEIKKE